MLLVSSAVDAAARVRPDSPALTGAFGTLSYRDLQALVACVRRSVEAGTGPDDLIEIEMAPQPQAVAALLACESAGRSAVLVPPGLPAGERHEVRRNSGLRVALRVGPGRNCPLFEPVRTDGALSPAMPHAIAQLTSGSLGPSQLAVRPWYALRNEIQAVAARLGLSPSDRILCASSLAHSYGLVGGLLTALTAGAHVFLSTADAPEPAGTAPTVIFGLARTYQSLLAHVRPREGLATVRVALSAGAPLPTGLFHAMRQTTGVSIRQDYGTTETGTISIDTSDPPRPNTVGTPLEHVEVRSAEPGHEIQVRSAAVAVGYLVERSIVPCLDGDGWYHTRDSGALRDGILVVGRRLRPAMHVASGSVPPEIVEDAITAIAGVREAAVLPVTREGGARIRAVVATNLDAESLSERLSSALPVDQRPQEIEIVDALPRSPAGKVLQKYLV